MINKHDFQQAAKSFRAGRLSLQKLTAQVFADQKSSSLLSSESVNQKSKSVKTDGTTDRTTDGTTDRMADRMAEELAIDRNDSATLPQIKVRSAESHKGNFGRVLLIGGSAGMSGAISLASLAALRTGSGLVKVAVPKEIQSVVAAFSPCYMTIGCLSENGEFHGACLDSLETAAAWSDVVALGPGMERGSAQKWIVPKLYRETKQPMVVDADGLNALADAEVDLSDHAGQRILTPHPGEFQRLLGFQTADRAALESRAIELAATANLVIVLKGHRTLVTDGKQTYHNSTGNPGMATAGSGDVLTGIIASLIGQGFSLFEAGQLGVCLHGMAGDCAAEQVGEASLIATDLVDRLPSVISQHSMATQASTRTVKQIR